MDIEATIFIDRDGVLIVDTGYPSEPEEIEMSQSALRFISFWSSKGVKVIVITNQSGVARGYFTLKAVDRINQRIQEACSDLGGVIEAFFICPHHPDGIIPEFSVDCSCRKPKPGLIDMATVACGVNKQKSFLIGDKVSDITAGLNAGLSPHRCVLVDSVSSSEAKLPMHSSRFFLQVSGIHNALLSLV